MCTTASPSFFETLSTFVPESVRSSESFSGDAVTSRYSLSQETGSFILELFQETQVAVEKLTDVFDAVFQHRQALDAHAERETGVFLGVDLDAFQHVGMHHAS